MASRLYNYRQGDRSELLADFLLSGIGITTPIRRQDDVGYDFYCSISDQEKGTLTFGSPYIIQIKSKGKDNSIIFGNDTPSDWAYHQVEWLFRNELPLFFGIVDKKTQSIAIHDCSSFGYAKMLNSMWPAKVIFEPRSDIHVTRDIDKPTETPIEKWDNDGSNGKIYKVDIGHPIITLNNEDFDDDMLIKNKKNLLRQAILIQSQSLLFYKMKLGYLNWIVNNTPNETILPGWAFITSENPEDTKNTINKNAVAIISIGLHAKSHKKSEIVNAIKVISGYFHDDTVPFQIKSKNPDLF